MALRIFAEDASAYFGAPAAANNGLSPHALRSQCPYTSHCEDFGAPHPPFIFHPSPTTASRSSSSRRSSSLSSATSFFVSEDQEAAQRRKLKTSTLHGQLQRFVPLVREVIDPGIKNQKEKIKAFQRIATKVAHLLTAEVGKLRDTLHETVSELDDAVKMNKEFATHLMEQLRAEEDGTSTYILQVGSGRSRSSLITPMLPFDD